MAGIVSTAVQLPAQLPIWSAPTLPNLTLSEGEQSLLRRLTMRATADQAELIDCDTYYRGEEWIRQIGIALPPDLDFLRTLVGWPKIAVDPYVDRLFVDGFRLPGANDSDSYLRELWDANRMDAEQSLAFTDALAMARGYFTVGSNPAGGAPLIRAESPLNIVVDHGLDGRTPVAALQSYWVDARAHAAFYTPTQTITLAQDDNQKWVITDRDVHNFGRVPVVRIANNPRSSRRDGRSEITPELKSIVDACCRELVILAVAGEMYGVPRLLLMGVTEEDFQSPDGSRKSNFQTYITRLLAFERDENGELPTATQLTAYDPSAFTKVIEMYASQASGILHAPPQDLGLYTDGNPVNAEAAKVSENRRDRRAIGKQKAWGGDIVDLMQLVVRFDNGGALPAKYQRFTTDWADVSIQDTAGEADAITKYVAAEVLPPRSDVTLKKARLTAAERAQVQQDWAEQDARKSLELLAANVQQAALGRQQPAQQPETGPVTGGEPGAAG